jgi:hypothetical protein
VSPAHRSRTPLAIPRPIMCASQTQPVLSHLLQAINGSQFLKLLHDLGVAAGIDPRRESAFRQHVEERRELPDLSMTISPRVSTW